MCSVRREKCAPSERGHRAWVLAKEMRVEPMRDWMQPPQIELYIAFPEHFIANWDTIVNTRHRHPEGYNPHKRGRKNHHPILCVAVCTRLCLDFEWRLGDTVIATGWHSAMEKLWSQLDPPRGALAQSRRRGLGQEALSGHAGEKRPEDLFKLRLTIKVRHSIAKVPWPY